MARTCRKCSRSLPSVGIDPHLECLACRVMECSWVSRCDRCASLSEEQFRLFLRNVESRRQRRTRSASSGKRKQSSSSGSQIEKRMRCMEETLDRLAQVMCSPHGSPFSGFQAPSAPGVSVGSQPGTSGLPRAMVGEPVGGTGGTSCSPDDARRADTNRAELFSAELGTTTMRGPSCAPTARETVCSVSDTVGAGHGRGDDISHGAHRPGGHPPTADPISCYRPQVRPVCQEGIQNRHYGSGHGRGDGISHGALRPGGNPPTADPISCSRPRLSPVCQERIQDGQGWVSPSLRHGSQAPIQEGEVNTCPQAIRPGTQPPFPHSGFLGSRSDDLPLVQDQLVGCPSALKPGSQPVTSNLGNFGPASSPDCLPPYQVEDNEEEEEGVPSTLTAGSPFIHMIECVREFLQVPVPEASTPAQLTGVERTQGPAVSGPSPLTLPRSLMAQEVRDEVQEAALELLEMNSKRVPTDKLLCLVSAAHHVLQVLKQSHSGTPASADDFLPALIYCVLQANPPLLHSNISFITYFSQQRSLQSGEPGYFFTNLCCAVAFIEHVTAQSLGLTEDEYQRYMTGLALPHHALDGDAWLCEGMRVMQQNLKTLDDLQAKMEHLVIHSDELMQEMDDLQDNVSKEVASVLERNPLTIHPRRKVAIDEELPVSTLLPSPLTPEVPPLSPDIIAAQQSLSFLQQLDDGGSQTTSPDMPDTSIQASKSTSRNDFMGSEADLLSLDIDPEEIDSSTQCLTGLLGYNIDLLGPDSDSQKVESSMLQSASGLPDLIGPARSTEHSTNHMNHKDFSNLEEIGSSKTSNEGMSALNQPYSSMQTQNMIHYSTPQTKSEKPMSGTPSWQASLPYSGFTVQGGKIPSIACETGNTHSLSSPIEQSQSGRSDPLSPSLIGSQLALPPPLIPSIPGERQEARALGEKSNEKKDALDKDIVETFDSLL